MNLRAIHCEREFDEEKDVNDKITVYSCEILKKKIKNLKMGVSID